MKLLLNLSYITAIASFVIGTSLLAFYLFFRAEDLLIIGLIHVIVAFLVNSGIVLSLIISIFMYKEYKFKAVKAIGVLLINIPITFLYLYILDIFGF